MCHPSQPSNGRYPFPYPPGASSPHPPPLAHPRPHPRGTARVRMNLHPLIEGGAGSAEEAEESKDRWITEGEKTLSDRIPQSRSDRMTPRDRTPQNKLVSTGSRSQTLHQWGTLASEKADICHPRWCPRINHGSKKRAHNWCVELTAVKYIDPYSYFSY